MNKPGWIKMGSRYGFCPCDCPGPGSGFQKSARGLPFDHPRDGLFLLAIVSRVGQSLGKRPKKEPELLDSSCGYGSNVDGELVEKVAWANVKIF